MKKLLALLLAALMLAGVACAETSLLGGWTCTASPEMTEEAQAAFEKAFATQVGVDYTPVALLGTQLVSGTNYCILCSATVVAPDAQPAYKLVYLYQSLSGEVEILNIADLDLAALATPAEVQP